VDRSLKSVRNAVYKMLDGFSDLRVKRSPLRMTISKGNTTLELSQLSDGEKCTLALIGDLARRLALANPSINNPCHGNGIVLIDEIELHMHPTWQRRIIPTLRDIFPNIQFIITTHSPQVLGEIDDTINIFEIRQENNEFIIEKIKSLIAWDSNLILEELMGTSSLNTVIKGKITRMFELIQEKNYKEALKFAEEIDNLSQGKNPDVIKAQILISRGTSKSNEKN
jgi:predicted ATP-binding protein involved in virulence